MSSVILDLAAKAILPSTSEGQLEGKSVIHWSYKLFIAGSIVGAIAAVAGLLLSLIPLIIVGAVLCVTNAAAAIYVKKFSILNTLDDYNKVLAGKVDELKIANTSLENINKELQKVPNQWRDEVQKGKKELEEKTEELKKIAERLQATEEKLQNLAKVSTEITKKTEELTSVALEFTKENDLFGERAAKLSNEVDEISQHNIDLVKLIQDTDKNTDQYEILNRQFRDQMKILDELFGLMKDLYLKAQERMQELEIQVDELSIVVPDAVNSSIRAEQAAHELAELQNKYSLLMQKLEETVEKLKKYNLYKEAYKELQKLKESAEWKEFQNFKQGK